MKNICTDRDMNEAILGEDYEMTIPDDYHNLTLLLIGGMEIHPDADEAEDLLDDPDYCYWEGYILQRPTNVNPFQHPPMNAGKDDKKLADWWHRRSEE